MTRELIAFFEIVVDAAMSIGLGSLAAGLYFEFIGNKRALGRLSYSGKTDLLHRPETS